MIDNQVGYNNANFKTFVQNITKYSITKMERTKNSSIYKEKPLAEKYFNIETQRFSTNKKKNLDDANKIFTNHFKTFQKKSFQLERGEKNQQKITWAEAKHNKGWKYTKNGMDQTYSRKMQRKMNIAHF